jgi:hypothetical protein
MFKYFVLPLILLVVSCSSVAEKENEVLRKSVYAVNQSVEAGRFDLVKKYSAQTVRLVAPPKDKIKIEPVKKDSLIAILPEEFTNKKVIIEGSEDFKLLLNDKELKIRLDKEKVTMESFSKDVDNILRQKQDQKKEPATFSWIGWMFKLGGLFGLTGLVVIFVFFPALIPVVVSGLSSFISAANQFISFLYRLIFRRE